jgi:SPP1 gp7 family putative phage head morphogenesis protein
MLRVRKPTKRQTVLEEAVAAGVVVPARYYSAKHREEVADAARSAAKMASADQILYVIAQLEKHMVDGGKTLADFKRLAAGMNWEMPAWRVDLTLRNNMQRYYQAGAWEKFQRYKFARPYLMYMAINDERVRPNHLALNGVIRAVADEFWNTYAPPNGHNCRCSLRSLTPEQAKQIGGPTPLRKIPKNAGPDPGWDSHPLAGQRAAMAKRETAKSEYVKNRLIEANRKIREMERASPAPPQSVPPYAQAAENSPVRRTGRLVRDYRADEYKRLKRRFRYGVRYIEGQPEEWKNANPDFVAFALMKFDLLPEKVKKLYVGKAPKLELHLWAHPVVKEGPDVNRRISQPDWDERTLVNIGGVASGTVADVYESFQRLGNGDIAADHGRLQSTLYHEIGHTIDNHLADRPGGLKDWNGLRDAWQRDIDEALDAGRPLADRVAPYFASNDRRGMKEAIAETFVMAAEEQMGETLPTSDPSVAEFRHLLEAWRKWLK